MKKFFGDFYFLAPALGKKAEISGSIAPIFAPKPHLYITTSTAFPICKE